MENADQLTQLHQFILAWSMLGMLMLWAYISTKKMLDDIGTEDEDQDLWIR